MTACGRMHAPCIRDGRGAEECYRIAVELGRQKKHQVTREPFANNCREWFEAKDRVW